MYFRLCAISPASMKSFFCAQQWIDSSRGLGARCSRHRRNPALPVKSQGKANHRHDLFSVKGISIVRLTVRFR